VEAFVTDSGKSDSSQPYAIIRAGGKQYRVQAGDTVRVEKLERALGDVFDLSDVLFVGGTKTFVGEPVLKGAKVTVVVTRQDRSPKVIVFKKKRRQGYRRMQGHRQTFTELFVQSITTPEGTTVTSSDQAHVIDPKKIEAKKAKIAAERQAEAAKVTGDKSEKKSAKRATAAKKRTAPKVKAKAKPRTKKPASTKKAAKAKTKSK
jgi:large subunit ribosomal protein L21